MKVAWQRHPVDLFMCLIWSVVLLPVVGLNLHLVRILLGLPFILFIPGYVLVFALFPGRDISILERVALSIGLSVAVVPLIGLFLNYTPWGIRLAPILVSLVGFVCVLSAVGWWRWQQLPLEKRFYVSIDIHLPRAESRTDTILTLVLVVVILISLALLIYLIVMPRVGESFTEFYLLGPGGMAEGYPTNLSLGENGSVIIGIVNHEHNQMNYTVEVWMVNQTREYNESSQENEIVVHNMWFMENLHISLNHTKVDAEGEWEPQWEYTYSFNSTREGTYKIVFLLFKGITEDFIKGHDYPEEAERVSQAYRELHIWTTIVDTPF